MKDRQWEIIHMLLPPTKHIWTADISQLSLPFLDTSKDDSPITILRFIHRMKDFKASDRTVQTFILQRVLKGEKERRWCLESNNDYDQTMAKILQYMKSKDTWIDIRHQLESGKRFSQDLEEQILIFKLVATEMGLKPEDADTKKYFMKAITPQVLPLWAIQQPDGSFIPFDQIVNRVKMNEEAYNASKVQNAYGAEKDGSEETDEDDEAAGTKVRS